MMISAEGGGGETLLQKLPVPDREYSVHKEFEKPLRRKEEGRQVPPYGARSQYRPTSLADYGDGGAFPEIHVLQFPLEMGRKDSSKKTSVLALETNAEGEVRYDAIVRQGSNRDKKVYASLSDMKPSGKDSMLALPTVEEEEKAAEKTRNALGAILSSKINSAKPTHLPEACGPQKHSFVRYTPNPGAPGYSDNTKQRIVKVVEAQIDPMEPPKHKHTKVPRGPPSPPVPVLHSPPRKLTAEDQEAWKIPPCISNWKNARGYTIPLDKRLAADGRGLQEHTVNDNFATLAEALYIAERSAREEVRLRAQIRQTNALQEKEAQEARLRDLAAAARQDRSQAAQQLTHTSHPASRALQDDDQDDDEAAAQRARLEREEARIARKRDRERQMRLDNAKGDTKRSRLERERERDVSEKVALGLLRGTAKLEGEAQFDKRLFNQTSGLDQGLTQDDEYNIYTKPLMDRQDAEAIYRPRNTESKYGDAEAQLSQLTTKSKFAAPARPFSGTTNDEDETRVIERRDGPVQFERDASTSLGLKTAAATSLPPDDDDAFGGAQDDDPFGLDKFLADVKSKAGRD